MLLLLFLLLMLERDAILHIFHQTADKSMCTHTYIDILYRERDAVETHITDMPVYYLTLSLSICSIGVRDRLPKWNWDTLSIRILSICNIYISEFIYFNPLTETIRLSSFDFSLSCCWLTFCCLF